MSVHTILEFSVAIPGTNAATEVAHSITNALWTRQNNHFLYETIKALIATKADFQHFSCNDFLSYFLCAQNKRGL
jgi:hypothetical protein